MRSVPASYDRCIRDLDTRPSDASAEWVPAEIDVERARLQQVGYLDLLDHVGIAVELWEEDEAHPDCCFVEDTAVVLDDRVLLTRPGSASRRGEGELWTVLDDWGSRYELHHMEEPATLDGGDVLRVAGTLFVGRTSRTNAAGIDYLTDVARRDGLEVVPVAVEAGLHLKSSVTLLDPERVVVWGDGVDLAPLRSRGIECVAVPEPQGANVLAFGSSVVVSAAAPRTAELIDSLGFEVHLDNVSEFHKGDGALTCLSLRFAKRGCWCV